MKHITGTIITFNEEDHIEACIASLKRVCDDVVVVDSLSTDRTAALAIAAGARVIAQAYLGEGAAAKPHVEARGSRLDTGPRRRRTA